MTDLTQERINVLRAKNKAEYATGPNPVKFQRFGLSQQEGEELLSPSACSTSGSYRTMRP
jgi:hypothetical protein